MIKKNKHRIFSLVIGFIAAYLKILIDYVLASVIEGSIINFEFYYYDFFTYTYLDSVFLHRGKKVGSIPQRGKYGFVSGIVSLILKN